MSTKKNASFAASTYPTPNQQTGGGGSLPTLPAGQVALGTGAPGLTSNADLAWNEATKAFEVGAGRINVGHSNTSAVAGNVAVGLSCDASGPDGSIAVGHTCTASDQGSTAIGSGCTATSAGATAIGETALSNDVGAVAIGSEANATAGGAVALGDAPTASSEGSVCLGESCTSTGIGSTACGFICTAHLTGAVAIGAGAIADGDGAVALGDGGNASFDATLVTGIDGSVEMNGQRTHANANGAVLNDVALVGTTPGLATGETVNLTTGGGSEFHLLSNTAYSISACITAADTNSANGSQTFLQTVNIFQGAVQGASTPTQFGSAAASSWTADITVVGSVLRVTVGTGSTTSALAVVARLDFEKVIA